MFKSLVVVISLMSLATTAARSEQPEALGSIWREGVKDDKTVFIVGTLRAIDDLDALAEAEAQGGNAAKSPKPLHDAFLRVEAQCSDDTFAIRVKADAFPQEEPLLTNESPYSFEDSPLRDASIIVNGQASLNLHYLWGAISGLGGSSADDRRNMAGSFYRFLKQIEERSKAEIKLYTPKGVAVYLLDKSYQETPDNKAIAEFKKACGEFVSNWH
jgi:hypothetical protein